MFVNKSRNDNKASYFSIDTFTDNVRDAVGAGDALLAYSTLAMLETKSEVVSAIIGSLAAACECEFDGNIPIQPDDILKKIDDLEIELNMGKNDLQVLIIGYGIQGKKKNITPKMFLLLWIQYLMKQILKI